MTTHGTKRFVLRVSGSYPEDGTDYTPKNIRYRLLKNQVDSWKDLLGDIENPLIQLEGGSIRFVFILPVIVYAALISDINALREGRTELSVPSRLTWYNRISTEAQNGTEYHLENNEGVEIATITKDNSSKLRRQKQSSMELTTLLQGRIINLGGKKMPNIHLQTTKGDIVIIKLDEETLTSLEENIVYKNKNIRVSYDYNPASGEVGNYRFKGFVMHRANPEAMRELVEHGTKVWSDIEDHVAWVRNQRGEQNS